MKIFISYSKQSLPKVLSLAQELLLLNNTVWYDQNLQGGQKWWDKILEEIRGTDIFIICLSKDYFESKACKLEQEYAKKLNKSFLPILIDEVENLEWINPLIQQIQYIKFFDNNFASRKALAESIAKISPSPPLPDLLPIPPSVPISILAFIAAEIESDEISNKTQEEIFETLVTQYNNPLSSSKAIFLLRKFKDYPDILKRISEQIDTLLKISPLAIKIDNCQNLKLSRYNQYDTTVSDISFLNNSTQYITGLGNGTLFLSEVDSPYSTDTEGDYNLRAIRFLKYLKAVITIGTKEITVRSELSTKDALGNPYEHKVGIMKIFSMQESGFSKVHEYTDYELQTLGMLASKDSREAEEGKISVWNIYAGLTGEIQSNAGTFFCMELSDDDSTLAIGTEDKSIIIYDLVWKRVIARLREGSSDTIRSVKLNHRTGILTAGDYKGSILIWDYKNQTLLNQFTAHSRNITDLQFSWNNDILASSSRDGSIKLWDVKSWKQTGELITDHSGVTCIRYSIIDELLIAGYRDGTLLLWDTKEGKEIKSIYTDDKITCLSWSTDGALLVSGHESGKVTFWTL